MVRMYEMHGFSPNSSTSTSTSSSSSLPLSLSLSTSITSAKYAFVVTAIGPHDCSKYSCLDGDFVMGQKRKDNMGLVSPNAKADANGNGNANTNANANANTSKRGYVNAGANAGKKFKQATLTSVMAVSTSTPLLTASSSTSTTLQHPQDRNQPQNQRQTQQSKFPGTATQKPRVQNATKDAPMVWRSFPSQTYTSSVLAYYSHTQLRTRLMQIRHGNDQQHALGSVFVKREQEEPNVPFYVPMAAFDLDDTLIKTRSGNVSYARKDEKDWKFSFPNVREKLMQAHDKGYLIVIITNQNQIHGAHDGKHAAKFKAVVEQVLKQLNIPGMILMAATQQDEYRKGVGSAMMDLIASLLSKAYDPSATLMFNRTVQPMVSVCLKDSYYVGDAAGRPGDHNKTDAEFAIHCRIHFMTETEYFEV